MKVQEDVHMATRQPHDAPPGTDAAPDQPERDHGTAAPRADAPGAEEQPTERLDLAAPPPDGEAAANRNGPDPTGDQGERPRWVAARPDPARQPGAHDGAPPGQPAAWGAPPAAPYQRSSSREPPAGDAPQEPTAAPVAGSGARPAWDGGQAGPSWGAGSGGAQQGRDLGAGDAGPSWGAGAENAQHGWGAAGAGQGRGGVGAADPGPSWGAAPADPGRDWGDGSVQSRRSWAGAPAAAGREWRDGSDQNGRDWGGGQRQDGPSWATAPAGSAGWGGNPAQAGSNSAPSGRRGLARILLVLVAAVGLLLTGAGLNRLASERSAGTVSDVPAAAPAAPLPAGAEPVAAVARILGPSVVQLEVADGLGSGVIYDKGGYILTAAHVTEGNQTVTVRLSDGTALRGRVVGSDPGNDIAVVKVDRGGLRPANLALKGTLQVGQMAVAIGSPFGLQQTVTQGVVSAKDRSLPTPDGKVLEVIQTDAPINPGNSGGALADRQGRVIGINDSIRSESGGNEGVGFAIPIDTAVASAAHIVKGEPIRTGYLGVSLNTPSLGRAGAVVDDVAPGSPAERAGLRVGDLIVKLGNRPIQSSDDLAAEVRLLAPGQNAVLGVLRDGKEQTVSVALGQRPSP
jgi:S1-C subfamily serine protease